MRRTVIIGLLALGCSLSSEPQGPPPLLPGLPRSLTPAEATLVSQSNDFGFALFGQVRSGAPDENVFLSPTSAAMALGMTLNGAAGTTLDSMRAALRLCSAQLADINAGFRGLIDLLRGLDPSVDFRLANSIWYRQGFPVEQSFLDAGMNFFDGRPVFGPTKTVRGVLVSVAATTAAAPLLGIAWWLGALIGASAMAGDLLSSFVKRRLNRPPSSRALGLDHIPESLLPLLACQALLKLTAADIAIVVAAFFAGAIVLSRLLYRLGLRDEPY